MFVTPPGPPPVKNNPVHLIRYARAFQKDPVEFVRGRFEKYGDIYYTSFRDVPLYVLRHPEHIREVLVTKGQSFQKPETGLTARQLRRFLGNGLVNSNGDFWRKQRRMINPAFARRRLEGLAPIMVDKTLALRERWRPGTTFDVGDEMMRLTLNIVTRALFDHDSEEDSDVVAGALDAFRNMSGTASFLPDWAPTPQNMKTRRGLARMDAIIYGLIEARSGESQEALKQRPDLLSTLLLMTDGGEAMSRKQLRDEVLTLFLAGHETTSQTLTWTFYLLSQNPEAEATLHAELDAVLDGRAPTVEDALPYTDRVITEAMRLFPPVTALARVATEPVEVGGWTIPKGADVISWLYLTHHDARWFPEPESFDPDRWTEERAAEVPRGAYLPFGAGQRQCIGKHFALIEARLILATLAQKFRLALKPSHPVERHMAVTLSPKHGMQMSLAARQ